MFSPSLRNLSIISFARASQRPISVYDATFNSDSKDDGGLGMPMDAKKNGVRVWYSSSLFQVNECQRLVPTRVLVIIGTAEKSRLSTAYISIHDINRSITNLVRTNWGDAYEAVLAKSKTEAVSWRTRKAQEILGLLERQQGVFAGSTGAREDSRKGNLHRYKQCFRNIGVGSALKNQAKEVTGPPAMSKQAAHVVVDGMFRLMGPAAGRILYEQAQASAKDGSTGKFAGNYQQGRKQSWLQTSEEERRTWEERAREEAQDVDRNQDLLLSIFNYLFMSLARSGRLGNMEFLTLLAVRDTKGMLRAESVIGGSSGEDFMDSDDDWAAHYLRPFQDWAEGVLPVSDDHRSMVQRDEAGYPLFPTDICPLETPANRLQIMLKTFLELFYKKFETQASEVEEVVANNPCGQGTGELDLSDQNLLRQITSLSPVNPYQRSTLLALLYTQLNQRHMYSIHSLAHWAPASRARVRSITTYKSPSSDSYNSPCSSALTPPISAPSCDAGPPKQQQFQLTTLRPPRDARPRNKKTYTSSLVDQAVKSLCDIWRPQDIPQIFLTTSRAACCFRTGFTHQSVNFNEK
ncbi:hypothetical protein FB446DRAFT_828271 [Lentinula raphanica]|nr:hypothetical protein FB446DRAFT_828271 [Lentinula raphanica]